jgi:hypothetical protein
VGAQVNGCAGVIKVGGSADLDPGHKASFKFSAASFK